MQIQVDADAVIAPDFKGKGARNRVIDSGLGVVQGCQSRYSRRSNSAPFQFDRDCTQIAENPNDARAGHGLRSFRRGSDHRPSDAQDGPNRICADDGEHAFHRNGRVTKLRAIQ